MERQLVHPLSGKELSEEKAAVFLPQEIVETVGTESSIAGSAASTSPSCNNSAATTSDIVDQPHESLDGNSTFTSAEEELNPIWQVKELSEEIAAVLHHQFVEIVRPESSIVGSAATTSPSCDNSAETTSDESFEDDSTSTSFEGVNNRISKAMYFYYPTPRPLWPTKSQSSNMSSASSVASYRSTPNYYFPTGSYYGFTSSSSSSSSSS